MLIPKFNKKDIDKIIQEKIQEYQKKLIRVLQYMGDTCVNEARQNGNYKNRTGNLRSSIGYVVLNNGVQISGVTNELNNIFISELKSKYSKGIVLIVVAGMKYSAYVEAKNYNVLTSAELLAEREIPRMLKEIGLK